MDHLQTIEIIVKYIGHIIAVFVLIQVYVIYYLKRKEFFHSLKGHDLLWQLAEISAIAWYMLFPMLVVADLLGHHASALVWGSMDFIYLANLSSKKYDKFINAKYGNKDTTNKENKENEAP